MPFLKGSKHPNWKGGESHEQGYVYIYMPGHHRATRHGKYVKRADLVLEIKLKRNLEPGELAHHKDGNRDNDSPENIELRTKVTHGQDAPHPTGADHPRWKAAAVCPLCGGKRKRGKKLCRSCYVKTGEAGRQVKRGWSTWKGKHSGPKINMER